MQNSKWVKQIYFVEVLHLYNTCYLNSLKIVNSLKMFLTVLKLVYNFVNLKYKVYMTRQYFYALIMTIMIS